MTERKGEGQSDEAHDRSERFKWERDWTPIAELSSVETSRG